MRGMPEIRKAWPNGSQTDARKSRHWKTRIESANAARQNISTSIVDIVAIVESSLPLLPAYLSTGSSGKRSQLKRNQRKKKPKQDYMKVRIHLLYNLYSSSGEPKLPYKAL